MKNKEKLLKNDVNYLILGISSDANNEIVNSLIENIRTNFNEIFYFKMDKNDSDINKEFQINYVDSTINIFSYLSNPYIEENILADYHTNTALYLNNLFDIKPANRKIFYTEVLELLLADIHNNLEKESFSLLDFIDILEEIITRANILNKTISNIKNKLSILEDIKNIYPVNWLLEEEYQDNAFKVRLILEDYLLNRQDNIKNIKFNINKYVDNEETIEYLSKLKIKLNEFKYELSNEPKTLVHQLNYFNESNNLYYLNIFLLTMIQVKKSQIKPDKPFIFIQGYQKSILQNLKERRIELFKYCNICFILDDINQMNKTYSENLVKIYSKNYMPLIDYYETYSKKYNEYYFIYH